MCARVCLQDSTECDQQHSRCAGADGMPVFTVLFNYYWTFTPPGKQQQRDYIENQ